MTKAELLRQLNDADDKDEIMVYDENDGLYFNIQCVYVEYDPHTKTKLGLLYFTQQ